MQNIELANKIISIITKYFEQELGMSLGISLKPTCFCTHTPGCDVQDKSPMAVPDILNKNVQIHINSDIEKWYPCQLLYQYSHELWHAYEFAQYGVDYSWQKFSDYIEPYAYAASLCALSEIMIPQHILSSEFQKAYFEIEKKRVPEKNIYAFGPKLAEEVGYSLHELYKQYQETVPPHILDGV